MVYVIRGKDFLNCEAIFQVSKMVGIVLVLDLYILRYKGITCSGTRHCHRSCCNGRLILAPTTGNEILEASAL